MLVLPTIASAQSEYVQRNRRAMGFNVSFMGNSEGSGCVFSAGASVSRSIDIGLAYGGVVGARSKVQLTSVVPSITAFLYKGYSQDGQMAVAMHAGYLADVTRHSNEDESRNATMIGPAIAFNSGSWQSSYLLVSASLMYVNWTEANASPTVGFDIGLSFCFRLGRKQIITLSAGVGRLDDRTSIGFGLGTIVESVPGGGREADF